MSCMVFPNTQRLGMHSLTLMEDGIFIMDALTRVLLLQYPNNRLKTAKKAACKEVLNKTAIIFSLKRPLTRAPLTCRQFHAKLQLRAESQNPALSPQKTLRL